MRPSLGILPLLSSSLRVELRQSVDPKINAYWKAQVGDRGGVVPQEIIDDPEALARFGEELDRFGQFVGQVAHKAFGLKTAPYRKPPSVHIVGTGVDLKYITGAANHLRMPVRVYDTCSTICKNAREVFHQMDLKKEAMYQPANHVYFADIERVCQQDVLDPESARYLCLVRVLETLNKPSGDPHKKQRVCHEIGTMLNYLKVIWIGAEPDDNEGVVFKNTEPDTLVHTAELMATGFCGEVRTTEYGKFRHYEHIYTSGLIEGIPIPA